MKITTLIGFGLYFGLILFSACGSPAPPPRTLNLHQQWSLSIGTDIGGYPISSGLGDISLDLSGDRVHMPFNGNVEPTDTNCIILSSDEVPAYLFRLCGLSAPQLGQQQQGQVLGRANHLVFAMLRREPDGTWAMVEPAPQFIEQLLVQGTSP